ncbi:transposase [Actinomadura harenae]|uniref:transposase n=1 Tax=Actinomadura harenae TaxID=2483351 RepID=UPI0018F27FF2|nr:transposase [Actinomadura harenae]
MGKKKEGPRAGRAKRRTFTPEYKLAIVAEWEQLTEPGARGALLRREGLYHSHIQDWKRLADAGSLNALAARPSGPKPSKSEADRQVEKLEREKAALAEELEKTKKALAIMGKAHELLTLLVEGSDSATPPRR